MRIGDVVMILFVTAVIYLAVRPGSPGPAWTENIAKMLESSILLVTAG